MNLGFISVALLTTLLFIILLLCSLDYKKKRVLKSKPYVSFITPCYNDGTSIAETVQSIYSSYDQKRFEIIIIDDKSTDDSAAVLRKLKTKYRFKLFTNKKNRGKAATLNSAYKKAKYDILFFVDADTILNKEAVSDILARLAGEAVAVSAPYQPKERGFLARMQEIEYNMLALLQGAHNNFSTVSLWGGCFAIKKKYFQEAGFFSENAIIEDMDLALKLKEEGYDVEQSFYFVKTGVPLTVKSWYKQKIRWTSGGAQNLVKHFKVWIRSPLHLLFIILFSVLSILYVRSVIAQVLFWDNIFDNLVIIAKGTLSLVTLKATTFYYGALLVKNFFQTASFSVFSLPYVIPMSWPFKKLAKLLYIIPYSLVYYPIYSLISLIGFIVGLVRYRSLEKGKRAW